MRASICIFGSHIDYTDKRVCPEVPDAIFPAVETAIATKQPQFLQLTQGLFLVVPLEFGPFSKELAAESPKWLPVKVYRFERWECGGIRDEEMLIYLEKKGEP